MKEKRIDEKASYSEILESGKTHVITDKETGSKAFVPIRMDQGEKTEIVHIDGGLITGLPAGKHICDNLVYSIDSMVQNVKITWLIELKGTKKENEVQHAIRQIRESIDYLNDSVGFPKAEKYLKQRDYVFAAVAGAPDKTLPVMNNDDIKNLCKKLNSMCGERKKVKDMFALFCYIKPNKNCSGATRKGTKPPYDIQCYSSKTGYISYPSMLMELLR